MCDFLKANPWCSRDEYLWGMTIPQVKLASIDFTHTEYLASDEQKEKKAAKARKLDAIPMI